GLQELRLLTCPTSLGCLTPPLSDLLSTILVLVIPYALLRLVDDVANVPDWQMWLSLVLLIAIGFSLAVAGSTPPSVLVIVLTIYLVVGSSYAARSFGRRAQATLGITRRRMAAVAWGCGLLAAAIVLGVLASASPTNEPLLTPLVRLSGLVSGICF